MIDAAQVMQALAARHLTPDARQRQAIDALVKLGAPRATHAGVYCHGRPGRGKSLVVDTAFALAVGEKRRIHFHEFLREINRLIVREPRCDDKLAAVSQRWLTGVELLCFDEFHVHDIADAFLIGRFLDIALAMRVRLVLTSNYAPEDLFPDPEFHARFEPTIAILKQRFAIVHFDGARDYRVGGEAARLARFISPIDAARPVLREAYFCMEGAAPGDAGETVTIAGRPLIATAVGERMLWADFEGLCVASRSHLDYLALAECWAGLIVDNLQVAMLSRPDTLQRFLWLIDICYDRKRTLFIASDSSLDAALAALSDMRDLSRTISRLAEMRTRDYDVEMSVEPAAKKQESALS